MLLDIQLVTDWDGSCSVITSTCKVSGPYNSFPTSENIVKYSWLNSWIQLCLISYCCRKKIIREQRKCISFLPGTNLPSKKSLPFSSLHVGGSCYKRDGRDRNEKLYGIYNIKQYVPITVLPLGLTLHLLKNLIIIFWISVRKSIYLPQTLCFYHTVSECLLGI